MCGEEGAIAKLQCEGDIEQKTRPKSSSCICIVQRNFCWSL